MPAQESLARLCSVRGEEAAAFQQVTLRRTALLVSLGGLGAEVRRTCQPKASLECIRSYKAPALPCCHLQMPPPFMTEHGSEGTVSYMPAVHWLGGLYATAAGYSALMVVDVSRNQLSVIDCLPNTVT